MRIIFPIVEGGNARPIEIIASRMVQKDSNAYLNLLPNHVSLLKIDKVMLAILCLGLPVRRRISISLFIRWWEGHEPILNGQSAQLAALIAMIGAQRRSVGPRGWLAEVEEIWTTGAVSVPDAPLSPRIEPVGITDRQKESLRQKFLAFVASDAPLFLCGSADALSLAQDAEGQGIKCVNLAELRGLLAEQERPNERYVVGIETGEIRRLLDTLFDGLFFRGWGFRAANMITASRIAFGLIAAFFVFIGDFATAIIAYFGGLMTDVADGMVARRYHGTSEFGKDFDRWVDMGFNVATAIGYLAGAILVWGRLWEVALLFILTGGLMGITRPFIEPHSALAKIRSGWIRIVLLGFLVVRLGKQYSWSLPAAGVVGAIVCCLLLILVVSYEIDQLFTEVRSGRRGWWTAKPRR